MLNLNNMPSGIGMQSRNESLEYQLNSIRNIKEWRDLHRHSEMTEYRIKENLYRFILKGVVVAEIRKHGGKWLLTQDDMVRHPDFERKCEDAENPIELGNK